MEALAPLRILIVDDNDQMRNIIGTVLGAIGVHQLHYASDGRRAMEIVNLVSIDVAYVDHEMPIMNGLDFISTVRRLESQDRYMPIIMLTGHSDRAHLDDARDRGVTEFLCKPVTAKTLINRLNAVIMQPRPFTFSDSYFGPDRRRVRRGNSAGPRRRASDNVATVEL